MANETKTVNFVRDSFREHGYYDNPDIFIDEQIQASRRKEKGKPLLPSDVAQ